MNKGFLGAAAIALVAATAQTANADAAAGDGADGNTDRDAIIVSATRRPVPATAIPNTIRLIDKDALTSQITISTNLIDALGQSVPSFSPSRQKLSGSGESFRGRSPLFLIDGVPQSNPLRDGSRDGFTIDPAVIERVEVIYGANAIQGVGATGGVINYVTLSPSTEDRWETRLQAQVTTNDGFQGDGFSYRGAATALRDFGAVDAVISLSSEKRGAFYDANGRRIGLDGVQGDIQDSFSYNGFVKLGWDITADQRLQVSANVYDLEGDGDYVLVDGDRAAGKPAISVRGDQEGDAPENKVRTFNLTYSHKNLFGGELQTQAFYQDFKAVFGGGVFPTFQDPALDPSGNLFDQSGNNSEKYGLKLAYSHDDVVIEGLSATVGVDYLRDRTFQELIQTGRLWVPDTRFRSIAPFLQLEQSLAGGRVTISGGVRNEFATLDVATFQTLPFYGSQTVDGGNPDFSQLLWNAGGTFEAIDGVTLYASYAEGFTMPDVGRVLRGINTPGEDVDTFLNLEPIIATNIELGTTVHRGPFRINASYFFSNSDFGQRLVLNTGGAFDVRRERTEIEGFEISLAADVNERLTLGGGYATLTGRVDTDGDNAVDSDLDGRNISPDRLNLYAEARAVDRVTTRVQASYLFNRAFDDPGAATDFNGYAIVDMILGYDFGRAGRIDLAAQNLLDKSYITYFSQTATTRNDQFFAGRGRTLTLRWSSEF